jgi:hypothetical protein
MGQSSWRGDPADEWAEATRVVTAILYDIEIHEAVPAGHAGRFCATVVNVVRLAPGPPVSVTPELHGKYGATSDAACSRIEAAVTKWVKDQTRSGRDTDQP